MKRNCEMMVLNENFSIELERRYIGFSDPERPGFASQNQKDAFCEAGTFLWGRIHKTVANSWRVRRYCHLPPSVYSRSHLYCSRYANSAYQDERSSRATSVHA